MSRGKTTILIRFAALPLLGAIFYLVSWEPIPMLQRDIVVRAVSCAGLNVMPKDYEAEPGLVCNRRWYIFNAECSYIDLVLLMGPFLLTQRRSVPAIVSFTVLISVGLFALASLRVALALYLEGHGVTWFWAHDVLDFVIYWPLLIFVIQRSIRYDLRQSHVEGTRHPPLEPALVIT